jgi:membrane protein DedA with SNARE-associated domain
VFEWVTGIVERTGYLGVAFLMFAENVFPPIPAELIMPLAGFAAARGELSAAPVVLAGSAGSLLGAWFWYEVGRRVGAERLKRWTGRHGRWLTLGPEEVDAARDWFGRHGGKAVLIGRMVPGVRTLISVPAGIAGMPLGPFLAYSAIGTVAWTGLLAGAGYLLADQYGRVSGWVNPVSNLALGVMVLGYFYRVVTFGPRRRRASSQR